MRSGILFFLVLTLHISVFAYDWGTNLGDGSAGNPYQVSEPNQLNAIGPDTTLLTKCYILTKDIDLSIYQNSSFNIIGYFAGNYISSNTKPFSGIFDGNGYSISNFTYEYSPDSYHQGLGLFACVHGDNAQIKNLTLNEPNVVGNNYVEGVGCLVGDLSGGGSVNNKGIIQNCHVQVGYAEGGHYVGLLVGVNGGTVLNCSTDGGQCLGSMVGSITGMNSHVIERCYADGIVEGEFNVGGFVGVNKGYIKDSYFMGSVSGENTVGGFAGDFMGFMGEQIENCYSGGSVSGNFDVGGFLGSSFSGTITSCYFLDTAGPDNGYGTPLDDPNMMIQSNFTNWDFVGEFTNGQNDIWRMCVDDVDYPRLSWEFSQNGDFACGDGTDIFDLQALAEHWLLTELDNPTVFNYACDANGDGVIDLADFSVLGDNW